MARKHRELMQLLAADIVSGLYEDRASLPPEAALCTEFGVSRGVVREAIRGLEERGLVLVRHGSGTRVTNEEFWNVLDPDVLGVLLQSVRGAPVRGEYLEARQMIEVEAAALAARRATDSDLTAIASAVARYEAAAKRALDNPIAESFVTSADVDFHQAVLRATKNRVLSRIVEPIHLALLKTRRPLSRPEIRFERIIDDHRGIAAAIAASDSDAARQAMEHHLESVRALFMEETLPFAVEEGGDDEDRPREQPGDRESRGASSPGIDDKGKRRRGGRR